MAESGNSRLESSGQRSRRVADQQRPTCRHGTHIHLDPVLAGQDVLSYREMMLGYAAARRLTRILVPLPLLTPRMSSLLLHLITPIPASISRALIEGMQNEVVVSDHAAEKMFPVTLIPYEEAVQRALQRIQSGAVETYWAGARTGLQPGVTLAVTEGMFLDERRVESSAGTGCTRSTNSSSRVCRARSRAALRHLRFADLDRRHAPNYAMILRGPTAGDLARRSQATATVAAPRPPDSTAFRRRRRCRPSCLRP